MTTLHDVAHLAQVSVSTVSRYLSGELKVRPETEERILQSLEQTGYYPNLIARSLRKGATNTLAAVIPDIYQPGIAGIVAGIDRRIKSTDYTLVLLMTGNEASREAESLQMLLARRVDGIIMVGRPAGVSGQDEHVKQVREQGIPVVYVARNFAESDIPEVCPDQEGGAFQATLHLLEEGYRDIGIIIGRRKHPDSLRKLAGYRRALQSKGVEFREELVVEGQYRLVPAKEAAGQLLRRDVDAIFGITDTMAVAALKYVQESGLSVPKDIAIVSHGGTLWADMVTPTLTTVVVDIEEEGFVAANLLLRLINGESDIPMLDVRPVHLRVGRSSIRD